MITLNGLRVVSLRIVTPWRGVPIVDADLDPDIVATAPNAAIPAVIVIDSPPPPITITGVVDPLAAGTFVAGAKARVICGAGGWSKDVPAQHFSNPGGLLSTAVYAATGAVVLEKVV